MHQNSLKAVIRKLTKCYNFIATYLKSIPEFLCRNLKVTSLKINWSAPYLLAREEVKLHYHVLLKNWTCLSLSPTFSVGWAIDYWRPVLDSLLEKFNICYIKDKGNDIHAINAKFYQHQSSSFWVIGTQSLDIRGLQKKMASMAKGNFEPYNSETTGLILNFVW